MTPGQRDAQDCGGSTGPYRRVWSQPGFSWMTATIFLPSKNAAPPDIAIGAGETGDTPFVYTGGWGTGGQAVDAGFQYSPTFDNWALFLKFQGKPEKVANPDTRFVGGNPVQLTFEVTEDNVLLVTAEGVRQDGNPAPITVQLTPAEGVVGWPASGDGVILKRMTSIGQMPENLGSGTFLNNVHWQGAKIGTSAEDAVSWLADQTGGHCMHPNNGQTVVVAFVDDSEETDNIRL